jgi:hypothetical protein
MFKMLCQYSSYRFKHVIQIAQFAGYVGIQRDHRMPFVIYRRYFEPAGFAGQPFYEPPGTKIKLTGIISGSF